MESQMKPADQKHIQRNFSKLVDALGSHAEDVSVLLLIEHRVIPRAMHEEIVQANKTKTQSARELLTVIQKRGPHAYEALYQAVLDSELYHAADILRPEKGTHWPKPEDPGESCTRDLQEAQGKPVAKLPQRGIPQNAGIDPDMEETDVIKGRGTRRAISDVKPPPPDVSIDENDASLSQTEVKRLDFLESGPRASASPTFETQPTEIDRRQKSNSRTSCLPIESPPEDAFKNISVKTVDFDSEMIKHYEESLRGQTYYAMKHDKRGRAVIIDNEEFCRMKLRKGTDKDSRALAVLFQFLGFKVKTYKNLKCQQILDSLDEESRLIKPSHDSFVLAILSHGCQGHVFGTDGDNQGNVPHNAVELAKIRDMFCQVENLINKPKLFFIQACRGRVEDEGIQARNEPAAEQDEITLNDAKVAMEKLQHEAPREESDDGEKTPSHADCFFAMSTTAGFVSYRHVEYGSWFIQSVVKVLSNYAHQYDLGRLMTMVNEQVSSKETQNGYKQVSEKSDTFRFLFCFFPGLNELTYQPVDRPL